MESTSSRSDRALLQELQQRRAQLRDSLAALEGALAAPPAGDPARWLQRVHVALVELAGDSRAHIEITEGPGGLHQDLLATSPRLSGPVAMLTAEHDVIRSELDDLVSRLAEPADDLDVADVREACTELLGRFVRHRQRGSDLVFEAYEYDLGGET